MQPSLREIHDLGPGDTTALSTLWPVGKHPKDLRCYNYATIITRGFITPGAGLLPMSNLGGYSSLYTKFDATDKTELYFAMAHDGIILAPNTEPGTLPDIPEGHFLMAMMFDSLGIVKGGNGRLYNAGVGFHALRHHPVHGFSSKNGHMEVSFTDENGHRINDPRTANMGRFDEFVAFGFIPFEGLPGHRNTAFLDDSLR